MGNLPMKLFLKLTCLLKVVELDKYIQAGI